MPHACSVEFKLNRTIHIHNKGYTYTIHTQNLALHKYPYTPWHPCTFARHKSRGKGIKLKNNSIILFKAIPIILPIILTYFAQYSQIIFNLILSALQQLCNKYHSKILAIYNTTN